MWHSLFDFRWTLIAAAFWFLLDSLSAKFVTPLFLPYCKEQKDLSARMTRSLKAAKNFYKFIYYLSVDLLAWHILNNNYVMPPMLGGSGSFDNQFKDYPYIRHPNLY